MLVGVVLTSVGWIPAPRRRNVVLAGATSGLLGTATAIGGPPMALVWQRNSGARLRGTMSGFFLVGSVMSLVVLAVTGAVDGAHAAGVRRADPAARRGLRCCRAASTAFSTRNGCAGWRSAPRHVGAVVLIGRELLAI